MGAYQLTIHQSGDADLCFTQTRARKRVPPLRGSRLPALRTKPSSGAGLLALDGAGLSIAIALLRDRDGARASHRPARRPFRR